MVERGAFAQARAQPVKITFHGVRGSCPCPSPADGRYGGNTSAVAVEVEGEPPLLLDLGTGVVRVAGRHGPERPFIANALVTHMHLDHVQGLPFFPAVHRAGTRIDIYGPPQQQGLLRDAFAGLIRPPYFPLRLDELQCQLHFHEVDHTDFSVGKANVRARPVPHLGPTVGYRIEWDGATLAYLSDHQAPATGTHVDPSVLQLCDGVDLLIHEAQYTPAELVAKPDWGHCTPGYAALVAAEAGARRLCLSHHDPWHSDDQIDLMLADARTACEATGVEEVIAAREGLVLTI